MKLGFNKQEAIQFISKGLEENHSQLSEEERQAFTQNAFAFDEAYMKEMGFYDEEESDEDLTYDEEDAFHYILGEFYKTTKYRKCKDTLLEDLVDDYLELKYDYLISKNLVEE
jgi:hypothetical protein